MRFSSLLGLCALLFFSCSDSSKTSVPAAPTSMEQAKGQMKNGEFTVEKVGFSSMFMGEAEPVKWEEEMKDTTKFFRDFVADRKDFSLHFTSDTSVNVRVGKTSYKGTYSLDTLLGEEEKVNSMKLRISYPDPEFQFPGADQLSDITYTYKVRGIDDKKLVLETPRSWNRSNVYLLLQKK
jgi:hypothetical protein